MTMPKLRMIGATINSFLLQATATLRLSSAQGIPPNTSLYAAFASAQKPFDLYSVFIIVYRTINNLPSSVNIVHTKNNYTTKDLIWQAPKHL
jgi:hypothetical protein